MLSSYSGEKLKALRKRARCTLKEVVAATGVMECTIVNLEHNKHKPQNVTLYKLLDFYAIRIKKLEHYETIWGEDGKQPIQRPQEKMEAMNTRPHKLAGTVSTTPATTATSLLDSPFSLSKEG